MKNLSMREFVKRVWIILLAVLIALYFTQIWNLFVRALNILVPFFIGMAVAYIWNIIMSKVEKLLFSKANSKFMKMIKRPVSMFISLIIILAVITLVFYLVVPQLYNSILLIGESIPKLARELYIKFIEYDADGIIGNGIREQLENISNNWEDISRRIITFARNNVGGFVGSTFGFLNSIVGLFVTAFTSIIFSIYLLVGKEDLGRDMNQILLVYVPDEKRGRVRYLINVFNDKFSSFFKGQFIDAIAIGVVLYVSMLISGLPYAITISVVVAATALVPMVGAFIGGAIGFIMIAAQSISQGWIFLIVFIIAQQLENNLIYPKLVGNSVGLPGIWTFSAVIIGGAIAGPIGMIVFIPIVATLYKVLFDDIEVKIKEKRHLK